MADHRCDASCAQGAPLWCSGAAPDRQVSPAAVPGTGRHGDPLSHRADLLLRLRILSAGTVAPRAALSHAISDQGDRLSVALSEREWRVRAGAAQGKGGIRPLLPG